MPEDIRNVEFMLGHELAAVPHIFFSALGVGRIGIRLLETAEAVIGFLQFRCGPVNGPELLHEGHARLVQHIGDGVMARVERLKVLVGLGGGVILLVREESSAAMV